MLLLLRRDSIDGSLVDGYESRISVGNGAQLLPCKDLKQSLMIAQSVRATL